jgi:hypothetical protein
MVDADPLWLLGARLRVTRPLFLRIGAGPCPTTSDNPIAWSHPATICSKSFMISSRWYGSLGLSSNVKC